MKIKHDAAVRADGHIDAGLLIILIPGSRYLNEGGSLPPSNALGFPGNTDGTAADAHLDKVRTSSSQVPEALPVHHVAGTYLDRVAVFFPDKVNGLFLPDGISLRGVNAQHIRAGLHQGRNPFRIVLRVDPGTHQVPLVRVLKGQGVLLMFCIVLAENKIHQVVLIVYHRQRVELIVPDDVVGLFQRGGRRRRNELFPGGHKLPDGNVRAHPRDSVVPAGHQPQKFAGGRGVLGDGHSGEAVLLLQGQHISQGGVGRQVGGTDDKTGLAAFHPAHHRGLVFNGLRAIDKR